MGEIKKNIFFPNQLLDRFLRVWGLIYALVSFDISPPCAGNTPTKVKRYLEVCDTQGRRGMRRRKAKREKAEPSVFLPRRRRLPHVGSCKAPYAACSHGYVTQAKVDEGDTKGTF